MLNPIELLAVTNLITKEFGANSPMAIKVATCESGLRPTAKNKRSSASGVFQITSGTWKWLKCEGDVFNATDNIKCAHKLFNKYGWGSTASWNSSRKCWGK